MNHSDNIVRVREIEREKEARLRSRSVSGSILDNQRDRTTHTMTGAYSKCDLGYSFQVIVRSFV